LERQKLPIRFSRDNLRLDFIDRKPPLVGALTHRFDCTILKNYLNPMYKERPVCYLDHILSNMFYNF